MEEPLPAGKIPPGLLDQILSGYAIEDDRVILGPRLGEDAAAINFGDRYLIAKSDPITFAADQLGWYAVHINANDLATMGAVPRWFLATFLLPQGTTTPELIRNLFRQVTDACRSIGATLVGGHTEITLDLPRPLIVGHMLGEVARGKMVTTGGARVGDSILLTKGVAIEGTAIIARDLKADLQKRGYSQKFLDRAQDYLLHPGISVLRDAMAALEAADVHAMHDPTEGGLATGLHEMADASGKGLLVDRDEIPVLDECARLCQDYGLDPLGLIASGSLLIAAAPPDAVKVRNALEMEGIPSAIVGSVEPPGSGVLLRQGSELVPLPRFDQDELTRIL
jgi:hydrogenase maturation factor